MKTSQAYGRCCRPRNRQESPRGQELMPRAPIIAGSLAASISQASSVQYLFLVGSGLGLLVMLLSSLPLALSHFFVPSSSSRSNSGLGSFLWMKLQNPPLTHPSPLLSLQHASRKSVTGDSSQYIGRAAYQRLLRASHAVWAESSYLKRA